jgi:hypothetical protein
VSEGVEFHMELQAKFDEAQKMLRQMTKVEVEAAKLDKALQKAAKTTTILQDVTGKVGGSFKSAGSGMAGHLKALATFEGIKGVGNMLLGLVDLGGEALHAAGEAERTRRSFETLMGVKPADELLGYLDHLAAKTEFTDGALKGFAGSLIRTGISGMDLKRALAATVDVASTFEDKMAGAQTAIGLISKIQLKGGVSDRELTGVGVKGADFFKRVADETGIGLKEVEKQIAAGKVKTTVLIEALYSEIASHTKKPLGDAGVGMSQTYLAQLEKAKDIIPNLFEELEKSGGFTKLTAGLSRLVEGLSPDSPAGGRIIRGLESMIERFGRLVGEIDFETWSGRLVTAIDYFTTLVEIGAEVGSQLGMLFSEFILFNESLGESLYDTVELIGDFFSAGIKLGSALWEGLQDGIVSGITWVVDSAKKLGDAAIGSLKSVLGIHSPSTVFAEAGMDTGEGFELGVMRSLPGVVDTVADAFGPGMLLPVVAGGAAQPNIGGGIGTGGAAALAAGGGPRMDAHVTINIGAAAGDEAGARQQAEQVSVSVRQAMQSIFEQWAGEGGAY